MTGTEMEMETGTENMTPAGLVVGLVGGAAPQPAQDKPKEKTAAAKDAPAAAADRKKP